MFFHTLMFCLVAYRMINGDLYIMLSLEEEQLLLCCFCMSLICPLKDRFSLCQILTSISTMPLRIRVNLQFDA